MNIALIAGLCVILLGLIVGYNILAQQRKQIESHKRQEMAKHIAVIDATEELIGNAHNLPYSGTLLVCLNKKILDSLKAMHEIDNSDKSIPQRISATQAQIDQIKQSFSNKESTSFRVPDSDRQAISMLKLVKRLRSVIKAEHSKGRLQTQAFVAENARLEQMQLKINIENVVKRANEAKRKGQLGTAQQLLKKAIDVLGTKNDNYSAQMKERLQQMHTEVTETLNTGHEKNKSDQEQEKSELDELFAPKKKW
ncbi:MULTISPECIES: DNA repair protein [Salinivibrio]|uniref:DNA repair protein n=1 Tax=Salinivibrio proteolyticus TaxID=334715 RepID=A0ABY7LJN0_9GAMM|nr:MULTISPECIES: DNA repair protein [Salinivibrio]OOF29017.1 DNA repair protein [Salinivibrio sp. IB872]WBA15705.1 DNA repair protein [Salinivibrio proteolyticus]